CRTMDSSMNCLSDTSGIRLSKIVCSRLPTMNRVLKIAFWRCSVLWEKRRFRSSYSIGPSPFDAQLITYRIATSCLFVNLLLSQTQQCGGRLSPAHAEGPYLS